MFTMLKQGVPTIACQRCRRFLSDGHSSTCTAVIGPPPELLAEIRAHADTHGAKEGFHSTLYWKPWTHHDGLEGELAYVHGDLKYAIWSWTDVSGDRWRAGHAYMDDNTPCADSKFGMNLHKIAARKRVEEIHNNRERTGR